MDLGFAFRLAAQLSLIQIVVGFVLAAVTWLVYEYIGVDFVFLGQAKRWLLIFSVYLVINVFSFAVGRRFME